MAWTAPRTWVTGETVTAALMNAHIRDNFLETSAATVTTAGDIAFADAANSMGNRLAIGAANGHMVVNDAGTAPAWRAVATDVDTASNTYDSSNGTVYVPLSDVNWGFASDIEVTVTTGTVALILWKARMSNNTAGSLTFLSYSVSSATTVSAADTFAINYESSVANDGAEFGGFDLRTGLTAGSNVFTLEGRVNANIGTIDNPEIAVIGW